MNDWGIPDWRNLTAYGETVDWEVYRWRWEFYRRRGDLREDYERNKWEHYELCRDVILEEGGTLSDVIHPEDKRFKVAVENCPEKYGYTSLPNPRFGDHRLSELYPLHDCESDLSVVLPGFNGKTSREVRVGENTYGFVFNLEKPLGPQLEAAKENLERAQIAVIGEKKQRKRRHKGKYLDYLRVLDARASGCSWAEISKILIHSAADAQNARDVHKQAEALCFNSWS
jgi:hypothetical protein